MTIDAYHVALKAIGYAWDCRSYPLYRTALERHAGVSLPLVDVREFLTGRDAWKRASLPMGVRFDITEAGRAALAASSPSEHGESTNAHSHR